MNIEAWIPHRPPFRFVDSFLEASDDEAHFALVLQADDSRLTGGMLAPLFLIEALAQSTAAFFGRAQSGTERGVLVEIDAAQFFSTARAGDEVRLSVRRAHLFGSLVRFACEASGTRGLLARASITVARDLADA